MSHRSQIGRSAPPRPTPRTTFPATPPGRNAQRGGLEDPRGRASTDWQRELPDCPGSRAVPKRQLLLAAVRPSLRTDTPPNLGERRVRQGDWRLRRPRTPRREAAPRAGGRDPAMSRRSMRPIPAPSLPAPRGAGQRAASGRQAALENAPGYAAVRAAPLRPALGIRWRAPRRIRPAERCEPSIGPPGNAPRPREPDVPPAAASHLGPCPQPASTRLPRARCAPGRRESESVGIPASRWCARRRDRYGC